MLFNVVIEGRLTASPTTGRTREGREYVQFPIVHRDRYRDHTGQWKDAKAMWFDVLCWGDLASRVRHLNRGDQVLVEAGQLLPYLNESDLPTLKLSARNVSVSMRFTEAHAGPNTRSRRGDIITTPDGDQFAADAYPDAITRPRTAAPLTNRTQAAHRPVAPPRDRLRGGDHRPSRRTVLSHVPARSGWRSLPPRAGSGSSHVPPHPRLDTGRQPNMDPTNCATYGSWIAATGPPAALALWLARRRARRRRAAESWERIITTADRLPDARLGQVVAVHQRACTGTKASVCWHGATTVQDVWFRGVHAVPGVWYLVTGFDRYGPHRHEPHLFDVTAVIASAPGRCLRRVAAPPVADLHAVLHAGRASVRVLAAAVGSAAVAPAGLRWRPGGPSAGSWASAGSRLPGAALASP
ncbi:single-stranded DNA-binding protein [Dactylosporangium sp. NPDC000521]|uniref:single-stranded DNA-binding protein n=1 Tax=Dactylosporangium sp. NPDC000521 TaxID=3363975 RepID=UPI0036BCB80F